MIKFCWKTTCLLAAGLLFGDPWNGELWNCLLLPAYTLIVLFFTFIFQPRIACSSPTANCLLWSIFQFYLFSRRVACFSLSARHWPKVRIVCFDWIIFVWETTSLTDTETFLPQKNCSIPIANACLKNWQKSQNREVSLLGVVHILRNHFWGSRETPPPCNIVIIWAFPPLCNTVIISPYPPYVKL